MTDRENKAYEKGVWAGLGVGIVLMCIVIVLSVTILS